MGDLLDKGLAWLGGKRRAHMARTVAYERGNDSVELLATPGRTEFEQDPEYGIVQRFESRDWLIDAADLVLAGVQVEPVAGDRIRDANGDQVAVYEVASPGGGLAAWKYSDPYRRTLRVHTKQVEVE